MLRLCDPGEGPDDPGDKVLTYQFNHNGNVVAMHGYLGFAVFAKLKKTSKPNIP